jgi:hypothetical protein
MDFDLNSVSPQQLQMLANVPAKPPPEGVVSNFVNPTTQAGLQIWPTSVLMVIALLFYFNRLYVKARLMKSWKWDDGIVIPLPLNLKSNIVNSVVTDRGGKSRIRFPY